MVLLKSLFILLVVAMPLAEVGRYLFFCTNCQSILLNDVLVIILSLSFLIFIFRKQKSETLRFVKPIYLMIAVMLVSLLLNMPSLSFTALLSSFLYIVRWSVYASLYFVVRNFPQSFKKKIPWMLIGAGSFIVLLGYIQYFYYPFLRYLYYLGWDDHLYRMFSTFFDPNFAGIFFALLFVLILGLFYQSLLQKKYKTMILLGIIGLFTFSACYLSYSRSALIVLVVSSVVFFITLRLYKVIGVFLFFAVLFIFIAPKSFQTEGTNLLRAASAEARLESAHNALFIFEKNPLYGVGFNAYRYAQRKYHFINEDNWQTTHAGAGADNSFLFVLATTGILGFSVYLYLWYIIVKGVRVIASKNKEKQILSAVTFASVMGFLVSGFFMNSHFYVFFLEWIWILIGLTSFDELRTRESA